jgi:hypothetical protein
MRIALAFAGALLCAPAAAQPPTANGFYPPPPAQIPAKMKSPRHVPPGAALIGVVPDIASGFIYWFPQSTREVPGGYDARMARVDASANGVTILETYLVSCGVKYKEWGDVLGYRSPMPDPGSPMGISQSFAYVLAPELSSKMLPVASKAEMAEWLATPIPDEAWKALRKMSTRVEGALLNAPMDRPSSRSGYAEELLIRAVCTSRPARFY